MVNLLLRGCDGNLGNSAELYCKVQLLTLAAGGDIAIQAACLINRQVQTTNSTKK